MFRSFFGRVEIVWPLDNCRNNPCQNGKCIDLEKDYRCECQPGYSGKICNKKFVKFGAGFYHIVDGASLL